MSKNKGNPIPALGMAFSVFFQAGKMKSVIICITYTLVTIIPSILLLVNKKIFEVFSAESFQINTIMYLLAFFVAANIISIVLSYIQTLMMKWVQHNIDIYLKREIHAKMIAVPYAEMDNPEMKDLVHRVTGLVPAKSAGLVFCVFTIGSLVVQFILASAVLFKINRGIPLLLIVFSLPYLFMYRSMCFDNYFTDVGQSKIHRKNWYLIKMLFEKNFNKELKHNRLFPYIGEKECSINTELHHLNYKLTKKYAVLGVVLEFIKGIGKGIAMIWTIYLILFRNANISALTVLIQVMDTMQQELLNIFSEMKDLNMTVMVFRDYQMFISLREGQGGEELPDTDNDIFFEVKDLSFSYAESEAEVLKNLNFCVRKGEKVAIVGRNGSGKTTLVNLLLGLYQPTKGNVLVFDLDCKQCFQKLRSKTVYIMQNMPKYAFSIEENLFMGNKECMNEKIIKLLDLDRMIQKAPYGKDTALGEENEHHYNISGGEWEKLGIARNCQKESPIIYILDEPTASLDPLMESKIYESFKTMTGDTTTVFISHRLGMSRLVDKIIVMNDGCIAEMGSHEELMKQKGEYYTMYSEQSKLYLKEGKV